MFWWPADPFSLGHLTFNLPLSQLSWQQYGVHFTVLKNVLGSQFSPSSGILPFAFD